MANFSKFDADDLFFVSKLLDLYTNKKLSKLAQAHFGYLWEIDKNENSGFIYMVDDDYNVLCLNEDTGLLDLWINTPYDGTEGFFFDLWNDIDSLHNDDQYFLRTIRNLA